MILYIYIYVPEFYTFHNENVLKIEDKSEFFLIWIFPITEFPLWDRRMQRSLEKIFLGQK